MSDERYTVFNWEMDDAESDEHVSGLTVEDAARELLRRADYRAEFHRTDGRMFLILRDLRPACGDDWPIIDEARHVSSTARSDVAAIRELYTQITNGAVGLRGPHLAVTDEAYTDGLAKMQVELSEEAAAFLATFHDGYWRTVIDRSKEKVADELVAKGLLRKQKQARRNFPPLYKLAPDRGRFPLDDDGGAAF